MGGTKTALGAFPTCGWDLRGRFLEAEDSNEKIHAPHPANSATSATVADTPAPKHTPQWERGGTLGDEVTGDFFFSSSLLDVSSEFLLVLPGKGSVSLLGSARS